MAKSKIERYLERIQQLFYNLRRSRLVIAHLKRQLTVAQYTIKQQRKTLHNMNISNKNRNEELEKYREWKRLAVNGNIIKKNTPPFFNIAGDGKLKR